MKTKFLLAFALFSCSFLCAYSRVNASVVIFAINGSLSETTHGPARIDTEITVVVNAGVLTDRETRAEEITTDDLEEVDEDDEVYPEESLAKLKPMVAYNFSGNKKGFSNFTPVINLGWEKKIAGKKKFGFFLEVNPYVAGQIDVTDSASFVPALMLPGVAGIKMNTYLRWKIADDQELSISPLSAGLKFMSDFADSGSTIAQFNVRSSINFSIANYMLVGLQYTRAWNNPTSESEKNYKKIFANSSVNMEYLLITIQTRLFKDIGGGTLKKPVFLFCEWRNLLNKDNFKGFDNGKIMTLGLRADLSLSDANPARIARGN